MSGLFITFEGIEGCGKSTQVERLAKRLAKASREVITLREPGGTVIGEAIRVVVKHPPGDEPISPDTELLLIAAKRGINIASVPAKWIDYPASTVNLINTAKEDFKGLLRLRFCGVPHLRRPDSLSPDL